MEGERKQTFYEGKSVQEFNFQYNRTLNLSFLLSPLSLSQIAKGLRYRVLSLLKNTNEGVNVIHTCKH